MIVNQLVFGLAELQIAYPQACLSMPKFVNRPSEKLSLFWNRRVRLSNS